MEKNLKKRALWILKTLKKTYPDAKCELNFKNPLELLIATILSAQCTDKRVNLVTQDLFKKYKKVSDYVKVPITALENDIRSTGFYRNKAKSIQRACVAIEKDYKGTVPATMDQLTTLPGVGRKTANVILGTAFKKNEGIVVDTHVTRISQLLKLTTNKNPEKIEQDLLGLFPQKDWTHISHLMIWHGRRTCVARRPDCPNCSLRPQCPFGVKRKSK